MPENKSAESDFISDCMSNPEHMHSFPDQQQRLAVCYSKWRRGEGRSTMANAMKHVRVKDDEGAVKDKWLSPDELYYWFAENTKDGHVTKDITLFREVQIKSAGDIIEWIMSDGSLDRDMERMDVTGGDLAYFEKNPIILWGHDTSVPAIGRVLEPHVKEGQLVGMMSFDPKDIDEFAWMIGQKVKRGTIRGGSIGFRPGQIELMEKPKDNTKLIHRKWELMEFSVCNIPSNLNAMAIGPMEIPHRYDRLITEFDENDLARKLDQLTSKIEALDKEIKSMIHSKQSYVEVLLQDRSETSSDATTAENQDDELDNLFAADETSRQNAEKKLEQLIGG